MTVEVYKGKHFEHGHERRALGRFLQELKSRFGEADELYIVVVEVDANGAAVDLLLLSSRTIIIADLKELTAATEEDVDGIQVQCIRNAQWKYSIPGKGQNIPLGGGNNKDKNPYKQIEGIRHKFADWLVEKIPTISGKQWDHDDALDHLNGWAVLSPGFDGNQKDLDLPWDEIRGHHNWFRVIPLKNLAWEFHCTTHLHFELTERELHALVEQLGATKVQNWGELLPTYFPTDLPPVAHSFLFSRQSEFSSLIGRDGEITEIMGWLNDPTISIISVKGMGGIGKTSLLGRLSKEVEANSWLTKYVACKEKELTAETFLAAVASEIDDRVMAHLILDKEVHLLDRIDVGLNYLEGKKTVLFIDDFQKISASKEIEQIILRTPPRSAGFKIVIASREHPELIDHPRLPYGSVRELSLDGLPKTDISRLFIDSQNIPENQQYLDWIWERTGGNPYAIGLLKPLIKRYGWSEIITDLPLYQNDKEHWFESLVETLDKDSRQLAFRISVIRTVIPNDLIAHLWHEPKQAALLTFDLVDKYVIQKTEHDGQFTIHDFIREYLYDNFSDPKQRTKAHLDAGSYYEHLANQSSNEYQIADALYEAIYHFERANQDEEILKLAQRAFLPLYKHGDWDRAHTVSTKALKAARSKSRFAEISHWLVQIAKWEFEHDQIKEAGLHLQQALDQLPKPSPKTTDKEKKNYLLIKAHIFVEKGRIAYYVSEFDRAKENLLEAQKIITEIGDQKLLADCLMRVARVERQKGDFSNSKLYFEEARKIAEQIDDYQMSIQAISHLALIARQEKDVQTARDLFTAAFLTAKKMDDWRGMEINRSLLADLARRQGDYSTAAEIFHECLKDSRRVGNGVAIRINLGQLAECLIRMGRLEEAHPYLIEAETRCLNAGDGIGIAWAIERKGLFLKKTGDIEGGNKLIRQAIEKLHEIGSEVYIQDFEKDLGPVQEPFPGLTN